MGLYPPSVSWQWAGIVIGIIALVGTMLTIPQVIWGRTTLAVKLQTIKKRGGSLLQCLFYNAPITNPVLKILNVDRKNLEGLLVWYEIEDANHKQVALGQVSQIKQGGQILKKPVVIPSSWEEIEFDIVLVNKNDTNYFGGNNGKRLTPQKYYINLRFFYSGRQKDYRDWFIVSQKPPYIAR
jgi:hypothetical protein